MRSVSVVLLVDARGWVLLQERDEHAPVAPSCWGMVGGQVEDGEDPEAAAYRELGEETGLAWTSGLSLWRQEERTWPGSEPIRYYIWAAPTDVSDADIVLGEGRQIVFVDPTAVPTLGLGGSATYFVPEFLASKTYSRLRDTATRLPRP